MNVNYVYALIMHYICMWSISIVKKMEKNYYLIHKIIAYMCRGRGRSTKT